MVFPEDETGPETSLSLILHIFSSMVENLCLHFGRDCGVIIDGEQKEKFFAFPCVER